MKFSRSNPDVRPFEAGGEAALEVQCSRNNCSLFALGSHQKKRPHNLVLGRLYDFRLYDAVEFGVRQYRSVQSFGGGAAQAQLGNKVSFGVGNLTPTSTAVGSRGGWSMQCAWFRCGQRCPLGSVGIGEHRVGASPSLQPCFVFVGDVFEADPSMRQVKSLLLDFFRGRQVESINLKGLDRVIFVTQHPESKLVLFRQYSVRYKKSGELLGAADGRCRARLNKPPVGQAPWRPSLMPTMARLHACGGMLWLWCPAGADGSLCRGAGTRVPRMELSEMGPTLDLEVRRSQQPPVDLEKEATKQPKLDKKKVGRGCGLHRAVSFAPVCCHA